MKKQLTVICLLILALGAQGKARQEILLEKNWKFSRGEYTDAHLKSYNDSAWQQVIVPHDWAIEGPFDKEIDSQKVAIEQNGDKVATERTGRTGSLPYIGTGWYRTQFTLPTNEEGKQVSLLFDGAMANAKVFVNGQEVGGWAYGYNAFHFNITQYLIKGEPNLIAVKLQNRPQSSRWYPGAGLYRPVTLLITNNVSIPIWGTTITTPKITPEYATVDVKTTINDAKGKTLLILTSIKDQKGKEVASDMRNVKINDNTDQFQLTIQNPQLWSPESPQLYTLQTLIYEGTTLRDETTTRFGVRTIQITPEKGFMLNGKVRKLQGVCLHHDLGPIGTAENLSAVRRQLTLLKEMGCDAIRTSHNMPSTQQMDLCDELGMMVIAESFDEWKAPKSKNGYNLLFEEWAEKDLVNLIQHHKNHPSIIMWSIGNEVTELSLKRGNKIAAYLQNICHREDPTRLVTCGMDRAKNAIETGIAAVLDVPAFNYNTNMYQTAYDQLPQGFILGSETASTVSSRGVYLFPVIEGKQVKHENIQCSSYDVEACSWSNLPEVDWYLQDNKSWVIGEFVWTGFDYLGEPTPYDEVWPSRSSYFGMLDLAGIPKDRFYLYRSRWNKQENTLHLLPHWNWEGREGQITPVYCYTNHPVAELFVNGKSQGKIHRDSLASDNNYRYKWNNVLYQPGSIRVVAYDKAGGVVGSKEIKTADKPAKIELTADRTTLVANGKELSFVTVKMVDKDGNLCPTAANDLKFTVKGAGTFRAACNGDATSLEPFHQPQMKLFNGMLVVLVQSTEQVGTIQLEVSAVGVKTGIANGVISLESK